MQLKQQPLVRVAADEMHKNLHHTKQPKHSKGITKQRAIQRLNNPVQQQEWQSEYD